MKSIAICCSSRFKKEIESLSNELRKLSIKVSEPFLHISAPNEWTQLSPTYQDYILRGLSYTHFEKIKKADIVYVYNKDEYIEVSTTLEIRYATAMNKPMIAYMKDSNKGCRDLFFDEYAQYAQEIIKLLN